MTHVSHYAAKVESKAVYEAFQCQRNTLDKLMFHILFFVPVEDVSAIGNVLSKEYQEQHLNFIQGYKITVNE